MNPETEIFKGVVSLPDSPTSLKIAFWKFDDDYDQTTSGRLWLDDASERLELGQEHVLTGGFGRWLVSIVERHQSNDGECQRSVWTFQVSEKDW